MKQSRIAPVSKKRLAEREQRQAIREALIARHGQVCVAKGVAPTPCRGPINVDEIISRARWPGGHLVESNCQLMCNGHNGWKEDHPDKAIELGLAKHSWDRDELRSHHETKGTTGDD